MKYQGVYCIELISFTNILDIKDNQGVNQRSLIDPSRDLQTNQNSILFFDFVSTNEEAQATGFSDTLKMGKKGYIDCQLALDDQLKNIEKDLVFTYQCDRGRFIGIIDYLMLSNIEGVQELQINLNDLSEIPHFKLKVKISLLYSNIPNNLVEKKVMNSTITEYLISFKKLLIIDAYIRADVLRSAPENEVQKREIVLKIEIGKQVVEFNIEDPEGPDRKNPQNDFLMYVYEGTKQIKFTVLEKFYTLERDEEAFLQSIRQINTKQTTSINKFLIDANGGNGNEDPRDLNSLMKKKKILKGEPFVIGQMTVPIEYTIITENTQFSIEQKLKLIIAETKFNEERKTEEKKNLVDVLGTFTVFHNSFIQAPRGRVEMEMIGYSKFSKDLNIEFQDLVFKVQKQIDANRDRILYIFNEKQWLNQLERPQIRFDTFYYDDQIKFDVFHRNSSVKSNMLGKGTIQLRHLSFEKESIVSVAIYNKKEEQNFGYVYLRFAYNPRPLHLYNPEWQNDIEILREKQKYLFFDSYLMNKFKNVCHFGYIFVQLKSIDIPKLTQINNDQNQMNQQQNSQFQQLYLVKIREGIHQSQIIVAAPNSILDIHHKEFYTQTQSLNERIQIEFYQILSEEAFNPEAKNNFKNLRLINHILLPLKFIPFDQDYALADNYNILTNLNKSGQVAQLTFKFMYQMQVPEERLFLENKPSNFQITGGFLFIKMVQNEDFALHHEKDLDKYVFSLEVINETKQQSYSKRLFFSKTLQQIGFVDLRIGDKMKLRFLVNKIGSISDKKEAELIEEFYYEYQQFGLQRINIIQFEDKALVELLPWQAINLKCMLNYDGMPKITTGNMLTNFQSQQSGQATIAQKITARQSMYGTNQTVGYRNTTLNPLSQQKKLILEGVMLDLELRNSDFQEASQNNQLDCTTIEIQFNRENLLDILLVKDLTENAHFELSNASFDKRALKDTKSFYLNEIDFDIPFVFRVFTPSDAIQVKIRDIVEVYACINLAEQPFIQDQYFSYFIQVGMKQMEVRLSMKFEVQAGVNVSGNGQMLGAKIFRDLVSNVKDVAAVQKESSEYSKKLQEISDKSAAEQIKLLKQFINDNDLKNKRLITRQQKLAKDYEKVLKKIEEGKNAKPLPPKPNIQPSQIKEFIDINKMFSGLAISQGDPPKKNPKYENLNLCACGNQNPKFKGYCGDCLRKLKDTFDRYLTKFNKLSEEYDAYTGIDQSKADEKIRLMKNKIEQYEIKLSDQEILNVVEKHEQLAKSDENRAYAEFKVTVQSMKQEIDIIKVKQDIDLQDLRKQVDYMEVQVAKKQGQKKDIEREKKILNDQVEQMSKQISEIEKRIVLKKRYVLKTQKFPDAIDNSKI
ncbi:UNKNOWN [Stylonychia lemnae]|uniref:Uncharacterized protein n=1 Tax=Stylonychia lemnae TaxID=5949 RepID=A0A078AYF7_STYLE|nr:UNKNOWN [Stylonychia lemnae]|eukprot:CDW87445.1 UNKNOWN [Stylonychia lemnae]